MSINIIRSGINSEVKLPLRWYAKEGLKNKYRRNCLDMESNCGYRLLMPNDTILPFQFFYENNDATIVRWQVYDLDGVATISLDQSMLTIIEVSNTDTPVDYVVFDGRNLGGTIIPQGYHYCEIEDSRGNIFYSEDFFTVGKSEEEMMLCHSYLAWSHDCQFVGNIMYPMGFVARMYFETGVEPVSQSPVIVREYDENGNKDKILRRQRRETTFSLDVGYVPWYLADALTEMSLHKNIYYNLPNDMGEGQLTQVNVKTKWDEFGVNCVAFTEIEFQLADATVTDGCCDDDIIPPPAVPCIERFCDPELDDRENVITDFTYTNAMAIADGLSVDSAPVRWGNSTWLDNQLCSNTPVDSGDVFILFTKTINIDNTYLFVFEIDSIVGQFDLFIDGVFRSSYDSIGIFELYITPDPLIPQMEILFNANIDTLACITYKSFNILVPCLVRTSLGWVAYDGGLLFIGAPVGAGFLYVGDNPSSNYIYNIEIDYELPVDGDCFNIHINNQIIKTVTSGIEPSIGTCAFTYDPRAYGVARNTIIPIFFTPCNSIGSLIGFTGIRFCCLLY